MVTGELWVCEDNVSGIDVMWKINNFFSHSWKPDENITSRDFKFGNYTCKISVLPRFTKTDSICFYVLCCCRNHPKMKLGCQLALKMDDGGLLYESATRKESYASKDFMYYIYDFPLAVVRERNSSSGVLTVSCKLIIEDIPEEVSTLDHTEAVTHAGILLNNVEIASTSSESSSSTEAESPVLSTPCNGSIQDFSNLSINGEDSDLTIRVQGENFKVHKSIFIVRCPMFASELQQKLATTNTNTISIDDLCGVSAFHAFLRFVYHGEVKNISTETAFELYVLADKYNLTELKQLCLKYKKRNENRIIILAA